jgi:AraC-like DNA-binding protein
MQTQKKDNAMNYGNHFSESGAAFAASKRIFISSRPTALSQHPFTIHRPLGAAASARLHCHRLIELVVTFRAARGEIHMESAGGTLHILNIDEYQCCLLPAGIGHAVRIENRHRCVSLFVDASVFTESLTDCIPGVVIEDLRKLAWRDPFANQLVSEFDSRETIYADSVLVRSMLVTLAVKLVEGFIGVYRGCVGVAEKGLTETEQKRAHAYIEAHLEQKFCVASLAKHMATSLPHLNRRFRATFGMPPLQYALRLRVDKALDLLRGGNTRVAEAAFSVGFCDQSHFDRHCRKFYGFPPGSLLRAAR